MGTDHLQGFDLVFARAAEIDRAYRYVGKEVPGVGAIGDNGEFLRRAVIGQGVEACHSNELAGANFLPEGI